MIEVIYEKIDRFFTVIQYLVVQVLKSYEIIVSIRDICVERGRVKCRGVHVFKHFLKVLILCFFGCCRLCYISFFVHVIGLQSEKAQSPPPKGLTISNRKHCSQTAPNSSISSPAFTSVMNVRHFVTHVIMLAQLLAWHALILCFSLASSPYLATADVRLPTKM